MTILRPALHQSRRVLVTGGCGFIGCNLADALASRNESVVVLDSLAREGAQENAAWLKERHGNRISIEITDVRDEAAVDALIPDVSAVLHLAGQVAVTTSLEQPKEDFAVNAFGTLNILEAVRRHNCRIPVIFASTNKVYGRLLADNLVSVRDGRYIVEEPALAHGVSEDTPLDLYSPYGCSKGAADQYVRDYARVFGLRTAVLRMSCIYGPRQFGTEDQGWIAHFFLRALRGAPITIYGDGYQVRDALYIDDAVAAWLGVLDRIDAVSGSVFNLGGGPANSLSLRELLDTIAKDLGSRPRVAFESARPGDQAWYISDIRKISRALKWSPSTSLAQGLPALAHWLSHRFGAAPAHEFLREAMA